MRRAFPAFRLYFVEEDNQGIFKRFDDFYSYNAITDIQMIKYKTRPAVMIITMTNMFGNLDAKTFDDFSSKDEIKQAALDSANSGKSATRMIERNGREYTVEEDGTVGGLREIMLKPGTKVVMKLGYENNPDDLPTTFAGQVTEVSGGEIMTIVCQDWTSEMFAGTIDSGEYLLPTNPQWFKKLLGTSSTWDIQGTVSVRNTLRAIMEHKSVQHFGHWQLGDNTQDPNYFGYKKESSWWVKPFDGVLTNMMGRFTNDKATARSRALINIHPETQPFYTAFGMDSRSYYPPEEEMRQMALWEVVQMQRRMMPNHVAIVRPYGQGDATLYFGPTWGIYQADEFNEEVDRNFVNATITRESREIFHRIINEGRTISVAGKDYVNSTILKRWFKRWFQGITSDLTSGTADVPIAEIIMASKEILSKAADKGTKGTGFLAAIDEIVFQSSIEKKRAKELVDELGVLEKGAIPPIIDKWYNVLLAINTTGGIHDDEQQEALLIDVLSKITQIINSEITLKAYQDPEFDRDGAIRRARKPVRRWHIATSKHHIIANNITVNSDFANEVRAGDFGVRFDPELTERRTRMADSELPESLLKREVSATIFLTSLLAEELRTMYGGQIILTGNAEIEPHDILFIFDDIRHVHGAVEVAKVSHIFNQEMGFITIVEPHLIVEQGDYSLSTALSATMSVLSEDVMENSRTRVGRTINRYANDLVTGGLPLTMQVAGGIVGGFAGMILGPIGSAAGAGVGQIIGRSLTGVAANYIMTQMLVPSEARNHPLTIFPLVKRTAPWLGGIEGASGRGLLGMINGRAIKGLKNIRNLFNGIADRTGELADGAGDAWDFFNKDNFGGLAPGQEVGNYK